MSSLEEPLCLDKLPSMSTVDVQRFSSSVCRPRADDMGWGTCWIEGRIAALPTVVGVKVSATSCFDRWSKQIRFHFLRLLTLWSLFPTYAGCA
ncbi:hypothetical protein Dimus_036313 [Dionaea muscipula]